MGKIKELPEAICEMETEVKSVQLDNEFLLYDFIHSSNCSNKISMYPSCGVKYN